MEEIIQNLKDAANLTRNAGDIAFTATGGVLWTDDFIRLENAIRDAMEEIQPTPRRAPEWDGGRYFGHIKD